MNLWRKRQRFIGPGETPWTPSPDTSDPILAGLAMGPPTGPARRPWRLALRAVRRSLPRPADAPARPLGALPSGRDRPALPRRPRRPPRRRIASAWSPVAPRDALSGALRPPARPETALPLRRPIPRPSARNIGSCALAGSLALRPPRAAPLALPWPSARPSRALRCRDALSHLINRAAQSRRFAVLQIRLGGWRSAYDACDRRQTSGHAASASSRVASLSATMRLLRVSIQPLGVCTRFGFGRPPAASRSRSAL